MSWSVTAEDSAAASVTIASGVTVYVVIASWESGTPTYMRWDGTDMTLAKSVALASNAAGIWFLNNPTAGSLSTTTDVTPVNWSAYMITGTIGETAAVRATAQTTHANNDFVVVTITSSVTGDLAFFAGSKTGTGDAWTNVDDTVPGGGREAGAASVAGTFGDSGDEQIVGCGVSLQIKPLAKSSGAITF